MKQVRIPELKARLREYVHAARRGETIAVFDGDTPVAQLVPFPKRAALRVRKPPDGTPEPRHIRLPEPLKLDIDVVQLLLEERRGHR